MLSAKSTRSLASFVALIAGLCLLLAAGPAAAQGPATLTGTVTEAGTGTPLVGAEVQLRNVETGAVPHRTTTGPDGTYQFARISPSTYALEVQLVGYKQRQITLLIEAGEARVRDVTLAQETESLETVVTTASRQRERLLDAPASVSVLDADRLHREAATSSAEALRHTPGVDVAQTGVDRREIALRGFNGVFSGTPYVLADHRPAAAPLLGLNTYSVMPGMTLDLDRIEVVRGPASALYGPVAGGGVVHFRTRSPFQDPGTSVAVTGGSRRYAGAQVRQAGVIDGTVGYKVTGQAARADEWGLNPQNPQDAAEIDRYRQYRPDETIPAGRETVNRQLRREDRFWKYQANGLLTYRLGTAASLSLRGGYSSLTSPLQTSIGTVQAGGLGTSYAQLRLETPAWSAQAFLNHNEAEEDLYLYRTGTSPIDEALQWGGHLRYTFNGGPLGTRGVLGGEVTGTRRTGTDAEALTAGVDDVEEAGAYLHTTTPLAPPLDLTLGARADYSSITDDLHLSPRAALVFAPTDRHALRATYNRAVAAPAAKLLFGTRPVVSQAEVVRSRIETLHLNSTPAARMVDVDQRFTRHGKRDAPLAGGLLPELQTITHTVEVGYKGAPTDRVRLGLDAYYEEQHNVVAPTSTEPLIYSNAGSIEYGGLDAALTTRPAPDLELSGTLSLVSDDLFAGGDVALNAPAFKAQGGVDYGLPAGVSVGATVRHVDGFPLRSGPYVGTVGAYTLLDVRAAYNVPALPGLRLTLTGSNVLDDRHREFVGAPPLGRMLTARLTYELP
jgi:iron complex outermembrane receptor protein